MVVCACVLWASIACSLLVLACYFFPERAGVATWRVFGIGGLVLLYCCGVLAKLFHILDASCFMASHFHKEWIDSLLGISHTDMFTHENPGRFGVAVVARSVKMVTPGYL